MVNQYLENLNPGSGHLHRNQYKKSDKHPDLTGWVKDPDGNLFRAAAWKKKNKKGETFLSISLTVPRDNGSAPATIYEPPGGGDDSDVPF